MKRNILYTSMLIAGMTLWTSCDHEPDFPGLDVKGETLTNVSKYTDTYLGAAFTADNPAKETLPGWLLKKYYTCDKGSSAMVTYKYAPTTPEYVSDVSAATLYTVKNEDYKNSVWINYDINCFTPLKKGAEYSLDVLRDAIDAPTDNQVVVVNYQQADEDAVFSGKALFEDDAESDKSKWQMILVSEGDNTNNWSISNYGGNSYFQESAYNKYKTGPVDAYLITAKPVTISDGQALFFDALYANYRKEGGKVSVLLSEDLAGFTKENIEAADWKDITAQLEIATSNNGSGNLAAVKKIPLSAYSGKSVYLAFRYQGDNTAGKNETSTIRLDNIVIRDANATVTSPKSHLACDIYKYNGKDGKWQLYPNIKILQPEDYTAMGVNKLSASSAEFYISTFLGLKYPYEELGSIKGIAFKLAEDEFMAIELQKTSTGWVSTSDVTEMTDEYEFDGSAWVYKRTVPKAALNQTFDEDGRKITEYDATMLEDWLNVALAEKPWYDKSYNSDNYTEASAYKATGAVDSWIVTPQLEIKSNYVLSFDMVSGHWTHDALHVYISDSFSGNKEDIKAETEGVWTEITKNFDIPKVVGAYGKWTNVGSFRLDSYVGKKVYIAFRYLGDKSKNETSTVQLDNIYVGE